jgi:hypothetical protein
MLPLASRFATQWVVQDRISEERCSAAARRGSWPPSWSPRNVSVKCEYNNRTKRLNMNPYFPHLANIRTALGFLCVTMAIALLGSCMLWGPCYTASDDRMMKLYRKARRGDGVRTSVFDKGDCVNPIRGLCKILVLLLAVPCECARRAGFGWRRRVYLSRSPDWPRTCRCAGLLWYIALKLTITVTKVSYCVLHTCRRRASFS